MTNDRCPPENPMTDIAALRENERRFPIMGGPSVPWSFVAPHARQAKENHDQTLERLAARGGLDPSELWCVVHSKAWHERASREVCDAWLREQVSLIAAYAAERDAALSEIEQLRGEVGRLGMREPTTEEMAGLLGDRQEIPVGDPYPTGWPTIRRCRHCLVPVAGGPTACVRCVARIEGEDAGRRDVTADAALMLGLDEERIDSLRGDLQRVTAERDAFGRGQDALQKRLAEIGAQYDDLLRRHETRVAEQIAAWLDEEAKSIYAQGNPYRPFENAEMDARADAYQVAANDIRAHAYRATKGGE